MNWGVNLGGLGLIVLIVWWFWLSHPKAAHAGAGPIEIVVDNGVYTPARIEVPAGRPITLRFLRRDASPCAEKVLFDDLGVSADLPPGKPADVTLSPPPGEHEFSCEMHMYRGRLVVR